MKPHGKYRVQFESDGYWSDEFSALDFDLVGYVLRKELAEDPDRAWRIIDSQGRRVVEVRP